MDWWTGLLNNLLASVIGGTVVSVIFYWLSGRDLKRTADAMKQEAETLRQLNILIIRAMQEAGLAQFNSDETGKPVGLVFSRKI